MTMLDVARHVDVSWDVVKDIQKRNLKCRFKRRRLRGLSEIAIDEIYLGKRDRFITVVLPELRRELQRVAEEKLQKAVLKGTSRLTHPLSLYLLSHQTLANSSLIPL